MSNIPASKLVNVIPSVLSAAGNPLSLNAVMLTASHRVPIGSVQSFATLADVQAWFGPSSIEATLAGVYFAGFETGTSLPSALYFAQYNAAAVSAYVRSGSFAGVTLTQIQAFSGTIIVTVDGVLVTTASIDLSSATSFSNAAALITTALNTADAGAAVCTYDAQLARFLITSTSTGVASTITFVTGTLATHMKFTSATGAQLSQGADAATPTAFMPNIVNQLQNWATFMTVFEPITADKLLFAQWVQTTNDRFAYVAWDSDITATEGPAPSSFGAQVVAAEMNGIFPIWEPADDNGNGRKAAFVCGTTASINFEARNGRIDFAYKGQAGLVADVTDAATGDNLFANGYNCYAAYATAADRFVNLQRGSTPGAWEWFDPYVNQIWLNSAIQLALIELLTSVNSLPYNAEGYNLIRAACNDPIQAGLNAGVIRPGVTLSNSQRAQVNTAAGVNVADTLQNNGFYLQILDASPTVRAARGSPPITLWYLDGGSIQYIQMASINVQ